MSVQNSHQISDIKVLLKIGANGNGIVSVEKTGTVGNVDTYTITFSDGTTTNFDLTNGTSIDTIEKTDTQGLVDTYTITLTDGSTTTFEVVNGGVEFGTLETETGNPLSFETDSAQVANNTTVNYAVTQSGTGDPSPSNVRSFTGFDSVSIGDFSAEVETFYAGTYDVEKGILTITHKRVDMGSINWTTYTEGGETVPYVYNGWFANKKITKEVSSQCCDIYKTTYESWSGLTNLCMAGSNSTRNIAIKDTNYLTTSAFKTAVTGHYIVYEMDEPIVIQLTPHIVELLEGANVVTSNGTSIDLVYKTGVGATLADLKPLAEDVNHLGDEVDGINDRVTSIEGNIANQEGTTASRAYSIGEWIVDSEGFSGVVTSAVSSGATWTLNTNYERKSLGDGLATKMRLVKIAESPATATTWGDKAEYIKPFYTSLPTLYRNYALIRVGTTIYNYVSAYYFDNIQTTDTKTQFSHINLGVSSGPVSVSTATIDSNGYTINDVTSDTLNANLILYALLPY